MNERFNKFVKTVLERSGWSLNRKVEQLVSKWEIELKTTDDLKMFPEAKKVLLEFGGIKVNQRGSGENFPVEPFEIDPSITIYEGERFAEYSNFLKTELYPLGEAFGGHSFLVIGEDGRVFWIMDRIFYIADNFDEALINMIIGIKPQSLRG